MSVEKRLACGVEGRECLQERYPKLRDKRNEVAKMVEEVVAALEK